MIMATDVLMKLQEGRRVRFGRARDVVAAAQVKADLELWISKGLTLTAANAQDAAEVVVPDSVVGIELIHETTPARGAPKLGT
jgi:hypothetical protein